MSGRIIILRKWVIPKDHHFLENFLRLGSVWIQLKIEKHCSKIIFKCVNSIMRPIFNEKVAEKWNLWVREQYTMCCDWLKQIGKVKICDYCSLNSTWTVTTTLKKLKNAWKKKKKKNADANALSKRSLNYKLPTSNWARIQVFCVFSLILVNITCGIWVGKKKKFILTISHVNIFI